MAIEILENSITHEARHDLESFYWLLVFIVVRHCAHSHKLGAGAFGHLFCPGSELETCATMKRGWLNRLKPLEVPGNGPLNELLERFRKLCLTNFNRTEETPRMTHSDVLTIFNDALVPDGVWPDPSGDIARPWVPPRNTKYSKKVADSMNQGVTPGTIDHTTAGDFCFPRYGNQPRQLHDPNYELSDEEKDGGSETDDDEVTGVLLPADGRPTSDAVGDELPPPVPSVQNANEEPTTDSRELTHNAPREPSPDGNPFARSSGSADQAQAESSRTAGRNMAETWPAAGPSARAGQRYNLRSSVRRIAVAGATSSLRTSDSADGSMHVATRSRVPATSRRRDNGTRDSSMGKRSRDGHDDAQGAELGAESHTSKRPRTLSTTGPRERSSSRKTGKRR